jgi:hypothetical protein
MPNYNNDSEELINLSEDPFVLHGLHSISDVSEDIVTDQLIIEDLLKELAFNEEGIVD